MSATNMPIYAFDTLVFANKLKQAGLDPKIAETQAELQAAVLSDLANNSQLSIKKDLKDLEIELKLQMSELKTDLLIKLGSIAVVCTSILGVLIALMTKMH